MLERLKYLPMIIDAKYVGNFTIEVEFDNGERKKTNCHKYLKGKIFEELKDEEKFKEFFIDGYTAVSYTHLTLPTTERV